MARETPDPTPPEGRRFSIRLPRPLWIGLAGGVLIVAAVALRVGVPVYRQQAAIREISAAGGAIGLRRHVPQGFMTFVGEKSTMEIFDSAETVWFDPDPKILGHRFKGSLNGPFSTRSARPRKIDDSTLRHIGQLTSLKTLHLAYTNVSGEGIEALRGLSQLEELHLDGTDVSDAQVAALAQLRRLKLLSVCDSRVTRRGFLQLRKELPSCRIFGGASLGYGDLANPDYCFSADELSASQTEPDHPD